MITINKPTGKSDHSRLVRRVACRQRISFRLYSFLIVMMSVQLQAHTCEAATSQLNEFQRVQASAPERFAQFGNSIDLAGNTLAVGAVAAEENGIEPGAVYLFEENGSGNWTEFSKLTADDAADTDRFGTSIAISGDTLLVGAEQDDDGGENSGSAYIFEKTGSQSWTQVDKFTASDVDAVDFFGSSVALSNSTAIIGAFLGNNSIGAETGAAYIFRDNGSSDWNEVTKITADDGLAGDLFGGAVAIDGNTAIVGARSTVNGAAEAGAVYVFREDTLGNWNQIAKLTASDASTEDFFGSSLSISGGTIAVGAYSDNNAGGGAAGSVYVFQEDDFGNWNEKDKILPNDIAPFDHFGFAVQVMGSTIVATSPQDDDDGLASGSAYVFRENGLGSWVEVAKLTASDATQADFFGSSIAIDGQMVVIGSSVDDHSGIQDAGSVYLYQVPQIVPEPGSIALALVGLCVASTRHRLG